MPVVSVILAFHQVTPFLRPAVRSILGQTLADLELLLVDNGTGQGLAALGDDAADPRIRLVSFPENRGIAAAHNAAVARARGEFIALMDYDDVALPRRLERQVEAFQADQQLGLLFTHAEAIDDAGRVIEPQFTLARTEDQRAFSAYAMPGTPPTLMGRRELFMAFPMREQFRVAPDFDQFTRIVERCATRALPEVLLHYRRHAGQTTNQAQALQVQNISRVRLLAARRRDRRRETGGPLAAEFGGWPAEAPSPAATYFEFTRRAEEERFHQLAVYFARKLLSVDRRPRALARAASTVGWTILRQPASAVTFLRMFFTGPLRTHGLRPL